jgi:hypothetical protein
MSCMLNTLYMFCTACCKLPLTEKDYLNKYWCHHNILYRKYIILRLRLKHLNRAINLNYSPCYELAFWIQSKWSDKPLTKADSLAIYRVVSDVVVKVRVGCAEKLKARIVDCPRRRIIRLLVIYSCDPSSLGRCGSEWVWKADCEGLNKLWIMRYWKWRIRILD